MLISVSLKCHLLPWLVWLSGLSIGLQTKGSSVQFPVRAHAWVAGQVPREGHVIGNHTYRCFSPSLSPSLPLSLKINKVFFLMSSFSVLIHCSFPSLLPISFPLFFIYYLWSNSHNISLSLSVSPSLSLSPSFEAPYLEKFKTDPSSHLQPELSLRPIQ